MPRQPMTDEERKAKKAQRNRNYYQAHREKIIERVKERGADPLPCAERRANKNHKHLESLKLCAHPTLKPFVNSILKLGLYKSLYPKEVELIETLVALISVDWETSPPRLEKPLSDQKD